MSIHIITAKQSFIVVISQKNKIDSQNKKTENFNSLVAVRAEAVGFTARFAPSITRLITCSDSLG